MKRKRSQSRRRTMTVRNGVVGCRCCKWLLRMRTSMSRPQVCVLRFTDSANESRDSTVLCSLTHRQTHWLDYLVYWVRLRSIAGTCNPQKIHIWANSLQVCCRFHYVSTASSHKNINKKQHPIQAWNSYLHKITTKIAYTASLLSLIHIWRCRRRG